MKLLWVGLLVIVLAAASGCVTGSGVGVPDTAYSYGKSLKTLAGWESAAVKNSLSDFGTDERRELLLRGATDAATWDYTRERETLFIRVEKYNSDEELTRAAAKFIGPLSWRDLITHIDIGDYGGIAGVFRAEANDPLALYTSKNNTVLYIYYYNNFGAYSATQKAKDTSFLVKIGEEILSRI